MNNRFIKWLVFFSTILLSATGTGAKPNDDDPAAFVGTWHVTSGTISIVLSIKPEGEALFILIGEGSHGIDNVTWKPMAGGVLIEGLPRFRFWKGRNRSEARVAMEPLPPKATSARMQQFPLTFMMKRMDTKRNDSQAVRERKLPAGWSEAMLPAEWDETAGRRRIVTPNQD